jgi:hypothetical protein
MTRVRLKNNLEEQVEVQEGNAGVYTSKVIIQRNANYDLDLDQNATYREYILITLPGKSKLEAFSSDDIADVKEIVIEKDEGTGIVSWRGVRSKGFDVLKFFKDLKFWRK